MSAWTDHVKSWAKTHGKTYACALSDPACKRAYKGNSKPIKEKSTMKGASKRKYVKADVARESLLKLQESKMKRRPIQVGMSPEPGFGISFNT